LVFFFFQAEDGIRDKLVTGVQSVLFRSVNRKRDPYGDCRDSKQAWPTDLEGIQACIHKDYRTLTMGLEGNHFALPWAATASWAFLTSSGSPR
jgi:hypothetical protein